LKGKSPEGVKLLRQIQILQHLVNEWRNMIT